MAIRLTSRSYLSLTISICAVLFVSICLAVFNYNAFYLLIPVILFCGWYVVYRPIFLFWTLVASLPFSTELQLSSTLGTDFPDELLMWSLAAIVFLLICRKRRLIDPNVWRHPLALLLLIHLVWIAVTVIFSKDPLISLKYLLAKGWYVLSFVGATIVFINSEKRIRFLGKLLIGGIFLATLVVFTRHALLGFSFDDVSKATTPFFRNHVNYSAMLVCAVPLVVAAYMLRKSLRMVCTVLLLFLLTAIFFSYSRGAWAALLAGTVVATAVHYKFLKALFLLFAVTTLAFGVYFSQHNRYLDYRPDYYKTVYHEQLGQHLEATYKFQDLSTAERFYRWIAAFRMMEGNWITGYGPNNFYPHYKSYGVTIFRTYVSDNKEKSTVHNYFLLLMVEQGLPGLIIFMLLFVAMFYYASKIYHSSHSRFIRIVALAISAILGMIAVLIMLSDLIETDKIGSLFFLCLGMLFVLNNLEKRYST